MLSYNDKSCVAATNIDIKYYVVKNRVHDQIIEFEHINIEQMFIQHEQKTRSRQGLMEYL
jgi:hypothetical protein